jgi:acetone carboxylase gamma subunit
MRVRITEALDICLELEQWVCNRCDAVLGAARSNYKEYCLVAEVPLREAHPPMVEGEMFSFTPDPDFCRLLEFYCPECAIIIENEYLPPGHPITHEIQLDIDSLKRRYGVMDDE